MPTSTAGCKQLTCNMTDLAKVTVACCPISLACPATRAQTWCSISLQNQLINKHTAWLTIFHTAEAVLWAGGCPIHPSMETQNHLLAKTRSEQQTSSIDWHVRGKGIAKHLCLPLLLILCYLYYSGPQVYGRDSNLIKRLLELMKTLQFIGLP